MEGWVGTTADRIVAAGHRRIVQQGYSGFSFADLAADVGIRKPSIHHHFPSKSDLTVAVVARSRAAIEAQTAALADAPDARVAVRRYADYWERCIADDSDPFCLAGVLAAEMPSLPAAVAAAVQSHFTALEGWLTSAFTLAHHQGHLHGAETPEREAEQFMAAVYGAMLAARVFHDPARFARIVARALRDVFGTVPHG